MNIDIEDRVTALEKGQNQMTELVNGLDTRLKKVEGIGDDVSNILGMVDKIAHRLKIWAPAIIGAAISAGIVNGKVGAFLHALITGIN